MRHVVFPFLLLPSLLWTAASSAQSLDDLRDQLAKEINNSNLGTGYAQMLSMFLDRSVSLSRLEVEDNQQQDEFDIIKLPLRYDFPLAGRDWKLALRGTLSHASLESTAPIAEQSEISAQWRAESGQVGIGLVIPWSEHWSATALTEVGISQLDNDASYRGEIAQSYAPLLDGVLVNWSTNVAVYSLRGGVSYDNLFAQNHGYQAKMRYTYSYIDTFSESRDLPPITADTSALVLSGEYRHPWPLSLGDYPLFGIVNAGATTFLGAERDALGFKYYYQAGYSIALDISARDNWIKSFSIGYQWNEGDNVSGQSILFNWELR